MRILVTGANKGIGLAAVEALLLRDATTTVLLGARDAARGAAARAALLAAHPGVDAARLAVVALDVASDASAAAAAAAVGAPLDGLVCNAGVASAPARAVLETNLHGVRRCVEAFRAALAPGARVVLVSSGVGPMLVAKCAGAARALLAGAPPADFAPLAAAAAAFEAALAAREAGDGGAALAAGGWPRDEAGAYGASKALLNVYCAQLAAGGLAAAACSPGFIATDLTRAFIVGKTPEEAGALPPAASAKVILHLLFGEGVVAGAYYGSDAKRSPIDAYRAPGAPEYAP